MSTSETADVGYQTVGLATYTILLPNAISHLGKMLLSKVSRVDGCVVLQWEAFNRQLNSSCDTLPHGWGSGLPKAYCNMWSPLLMSLMWGNDDQR